MLKLERVSKFYSAGGVVSSGFSKVNLEFRRGEFVAITGESGSGKTTLLNVISGLDSFEEGEMYIEGRPTSGFSGQDMEEYRKKYIGNIFQTFNLINSYTVYQNVELVLLLAGYRKDEIEDKVKSIIARVGLSDYERTKASKLSGGQKQRVAIARALARETPIIVADEPTGNLDSRSAADVIELLHDVSQDKLIIVVTHNYDQVEPYVTRKITMHDGKVVEDKKTGKQEVEEGEWQREANTPGQLSLGSTFRLGMRNTFNLPAKFLLLFFVFLFICNGTFMAYSSFKSQGSVTSGLGYTYYFTEARADRIEVTKEDRTLFTESDYEKLLALDHVKFLEREDILLDMPIGLYGESMEYYISAFAAKASDYESMLAAGRMPEKDDEIIFLFDEEDAYISDSMMESSLEQSLNAYDYSMGTELSDMIIVGYGYLTEEVKEFLEESTEWTDGIIGMTEDKLRDLEMDKVAESSDLEILIGDKIVTYSNYGYFNLTVGSSMEEGEILIPEDMAYIGGNGYTKATELTLQATNPFETKGVDLNISGTYNQQNVSAVVGVSDYDSVAGNIYISRADYEKLFGDVHYQASVFVEDARYGADVAEAIEAAGFTAFYIYQAYTSYEASTTAIMNTFRAIVLIGVLAVLFFVSYFIIKLIFKSRNSYYSISRMLGATKKNCAALIRWEMFIIFNIAFFVLAASVAGAAAEVYRPPALLISLARYIDPWDYLVLYAILCLISVLLAERNSGQMFKKTAMNAHREEV